MHLIDFQDLADKMRLDYDLGGTGALHPVRSDLCSLLILFQPLPWLNP